MAPRPVPSRSGRAEAQREARSWELPGPARPVAGTCRGRAVRPPRRRRHRHRHCHRHRGRCSRHDARRGQPRPRCQQPGQRRGGGGWRGKGGNLQEGARQSRGLRLQREGGGIKSGPSGTRREEELPQQGRCPPPAIPRDVPLPAPSPAAGSKGRAAGESHGLPSGGSPAGCSAGTSRIAPLLSVFAYLFLFLARLSARPHSCRCRRGGPAERGAAPRATRGGCADAEGGAGEALRAVPLSCPGEEPTSTPAPARVHARGEALNPACWRQEGVFGGVTSEGLRTCAALCRSC